ncbi:unnamed protein product [Blepharisma stoltei]|uniref:EF-hand domain-containing protein n=1 Tax=Blepharisma stoltei TaxID=1481888 RepID=A0AAU9I9Q8_9CILI|nr:unnamed protein product [Blepharisma stoltei]
MLKSESEYKLAKLFASLGEYELSVEVIRQVLGEHPDFEPFSIFKALDKSENSYLSAFDLLHFLRQNSVIISEQEAFTLVKNWDHNRDGRVSYSDFLESVLPATRPSLKAIATTRPPKLHISYDVEYSLVKLFQKELDLQRELDFNRKSLNSRYDFTIRAAFEVLDPKRLGYISRYYLLEFLRLNRFKVGESEIDAIFRRIDKDADGRVNYREFSDAVAIGNDEGSREYNSSGYFREDGYRTGRKTSPLRSGDRFTQSLREGEWAKSFRDSARRTSPLRGDNRLAQTFRESSFRESARRSSPLRTADLLSKSIREGETLRSYRSIERNSSPLRRSLSPKSPFLGSQGSVTQRVPPLESLRYSQPLRKSFDRSLSPSSQYRTSPRENFQSSNDLSRISLRSSGNAYRTFGSSIESPHLNSSTVDLRSSLRARPTSVVESVYLLRLLNEQILLDRQLESCLRNLALCSDFTLMDAFRLFDRKGLGYLSKIDIEDCFKSLGVYPTEEEIYLLFRHFDNDEDGRLRYSDICEMLAPKEHEYLTIIQARIPRNNKGEIFTSDTMIQLGKTLRCLVNNENSSERLRHEISKRPDFNATDTFCSLDYNRNSFISLEEFRKFLMDNGKYPSETDLLGLMNRYDRNRDGRVTFSEFVQEVTPKLTRKPY